MMTFDLSNGSTSFDILAQIHEYLDLYANPDAQICESEITAFSAKLYLR